VAIVWPCPLAVDAYARAGRDVEFPRPGCPACSAPMIFWSGYRRWVRQAGSCARVFVPRVRCRPCGVTHALLPAFVLAWRLDAAEAIGPVIALVAGGGCGVRPAAERAGVPHTTARGWVRRFAVRAPGLGAGFAALAVELGGPAITPPAGAGRLAVAAIGAAFAAASGLPGWAGLGAWRFASSVSGGMLVAANATSPWYVVGKRRFMPPVPPLPA
jgi:transposase-like protein